MSSPAPHSALTRFAALPAAALRVELGALTGDAIGGVDEVVAGDVYTLDRDAEARELVLQGGAAGAITVAVGSSVGRPGQAVAPLARHQVMGARGATVEVIVADLSGERLLLPLGPLSPQDEYTLIASEPAEGELAGVAQVSFCRGTRVTLSTGRQVAVEELEAGDRVLTRDHGPRPIRWTGRQTVRSGGANAPVVIGAGALNNADDLTLSPDHRLFVYQRRDALGAGRAEVLVRARHLVNGETIRWHPGGSVDYFHLLFDAHEIIYVEGIPAESLLVSPEVLAGMGEDLALEIGRRMAGRTQVPHFGVEPSAADLDGLDVAQVLRRASSRWDGA